STGVPTLTTTRGSRRHSKSPPAFASAETPGLSRNGARAAGSGAGGAARAGAGGGCCAQTDAMIAKEIPAAVVTRKRMRRLLGFSRIRKKALQLAVHPEQ